MSESEVRCMARASKVLLYCFAVGGALGLLLALTLSCRVVSRLYV